LKNWFDSEWYKKVMASEHYFELPFEYMHDGLRYYGRIDCLFRDGEVWHILEFKTATQTPENLKEYSAQVSVYATVLINAKYTVKASIYYLSENKVLPVEADLNILAEIGHLLVMRGGYNGSFNDSLGAI
jgi:hypothetical protein